MGRFSAVDGVVTHTCECGNSAQRPLAQLHKEGKCGKCKIAVPAPAQSIAVDTKTFDKIVKFSKVPVFVDFWASWCMPCKQVAPDVERLAASTSGRTLVLKVDTESNPALSQRLKVQSIPMFMIFVGGKSVAQRVGAMRAAEMQAWLQTLR